MLNNNGESITAFAQKIKLNPSLVRGRVCFMLNNFRIFSGVSNEID